MCRFSSKTLKSKYSQTPGNTWQIHEYLKMIYLPYSGQGQHGLTNKPCLSGEKLSPAQAQADLSFSDWAFEAISPSQLHDCEEHVYSLKTMTENTRVSMRVGC